MTKKDLENISGSLFKYLDSSAKIEAVEQKDSWRVKVSSEDSGRLIGKMGETLKALQYILRLMATQVAGEYTPLTLDVDGYKEKHEKELEEFALAVAENVKNSGYAQELKPMSPYDRRIVHAIINDFPGVKTESIGEGELRRVKVEPEK